MGKNELGEVENKQDVIWDRLIESREGGSKRKIREGKEREDTTKRR